MTTFPLLTFLVLLPLAGGVGVLALGRGRDRAARSLAMGVSLATLGASLALWIGFDPASANYQFVERHQWLPEFGISYHVGIDGISLFLVILTTFLTPIAILCSWESIEDRVRGFLFFMLALEAAMIGVFISSISSSLHLQDAMLIPVSFLIRIWGYDRRSAQRSSSCSTMAGGVLMLIAIIWLACTARIRRQRLSFDLVDLQREHPAALRPGCSSRSPWPSRSKCRCFRLHGCRRARQARQPADDSGRAAEDARMVCRASISALGRGPRGSRRASRCSPSSALYPARWSRWCSRI
jgi:NADH:ubiquinone oxidoreductase subunit 4 (subunit M)